MTTVKAAWKTRPLSECGQWVSGGTPSKSVSSYWNGDIPWISSKSLKTFDLSDSEDRISEDAVRNGTKLLPTGAVVFVVRGMSLANEFRVGVTAREVAFNQDLRAVVPKSDMDGRFLARFLRAKETVIMGLTDNASHGTKRLPTELIEAIQVPIPPLPEQRRIAAILDKADAIRRKREEGIRLTEELLRSTFLEMFGDPETNSKGWRRIRFSALLKTGMRNGISPSSEGTVAGKVLILSAITGAVFNAAQVKEGRFTSTFNNSQYVSTQDFLICRGNGNISLVGCGRFPSTSLNDTVFPDTMIAAGIDLSQIVPPFLERLWATPSVRRQIEYGARTTNGTYKINQKLLSGIELPIPPISEQRRYAEIATKASVVARQAAIAQSEALFSSLVQRAFRGEL